MRNDFAVFILSNGRPDNMKTIKALKKGNYTGKTYIIIDNEDETADKYYKKFGEDNVIMFNKSDYDTQFDIADNLQDRRGVVYARNACFDIAKKLGIKYFLELDDDYTCFMYRKVVNDKLIGIPCSKLDDLFEKTIEFLEKSNATTVAFAQGGDYIGGKDGGVFKKGLLRKAMNTFFCSVDRPFKFVGRINEDTTTYVDLGARGKLLFTITDVCITQTQTQKTSKGMTELYLDNGTYVKSFYSVLFNPSCVKVAMMGAKHQRMHHKIYWNNCTPKILNEKWKK